MGDPFSLVFGAISLAKQGQAARKQEQAQALQRRRSIRAAARERQIRASQAEQAAQGFGIRGSSALAGGLTGLGSQFGSTAGYSAAQSGLSRDISRLGQQANIFEGLSGFAGNFDSFGSFKSSMGID